jgi:hypothetical protein
MPKKRYRVGGDEMVGQGLPPERLTGAQGAVDSADLRPGGPVSSPGELVTAGLPYFAW